MSRMTRTAVYAHVGETRRFVIIQDVGPWNEHPTVTNDAEGVVAEIAPELKGRRLLYFDSEGRLDELLIKDGHFAGFRPFQGRDH